MQPYREAYHRLFDAASGELAQTLYNVRTVKDYVQEHKEYNTYSSLLKRYVEKLQLRLGMERWYITWRESATNAIRAGTMFLAIWFVIKGILTPGDLVLVFTLTEKAFLNIHRVGRIYNFLGDAHESLSRVRIILEEKNTLPEPLIPSLPVNKGGTIEVKNASFSYTTETVLEKVNFVVPAKKVVAIIGESGSGKTTLIKLITRHYDPTSGGIYLDGINLRRLALSTLRKKIAVVSQHIEIFNRTVHENIAYGTQQATRKKVVEAAKKANAHEFIMSFKQGYNTLVGEKGVRLSGGQQQRIGIARALLANPEILIFDEATSSLDSKSEIGIQKAIFTARGRYTMIIIAHRLSTIEHADIIVVMHRGQVIEMGAPEELLKKGKSFYKRMRVLQRLGEIRK
ncbi:MAG TPA: ABC transporter ATP-binding protein [Candidatus Nanoarchaeia archaeon]|nr:ABC transporter ATP-binding protein [Candidatus Nanoarchaeia archaeon]